MRERSGTFWKVAWEVSGSSKGKRCDNMHESMTVAMVCELRRHVKDIMSVFGRLMVLREELRDVARTGVDVECCSELEDLQEKVDSWLDVLRDFTSGGVAPLVVTRRFSVQVSEVERELRSDWRELRGLE